jgi:hypothetical protein
MDIFSFCKRQQLTDISDVDVDIDKALFSRGAGVAGCDVNALHTFVLREAPRECVLTPAGTDYKKLHFLLSLVWVKAITIFSPNRLPGSG